jgi:hypothetical protein
MLNDIQVSGSSFHCITGSMLNSMLLRGMQMFIPGHDADPTWFVGGNLGFAFSSNLDRWSVRPEGFIHYVIPQEGDHGSTMFGWGLSFTYNINLVKSK